MVYNGYYKVMSNIPKSWDIYQPLSLVHHESKLLTIFGVKSSHGIFISLPSGKRLHSELENHHVIAGKIHYVYGHVQ